MTKRIVIIGGGFAGTAVAARLERRLRRDEDVEILLFDRENFSVFTPLLPEVPSGALEPKHIVSPLRARLRRTTVRVVLVHPGDRILPEVGASLSAYALRKLRSRGVEVRLATRIAACGDDGVRLSTGETLPGDTLVWTAGVSAHPLLATLGLPRAAGGRLEVDATLAVTGHPHVFALGDCAAVRDPDTGTSYPPTAQYAIRQGKVAADNLVAALRGQVPRPFRYRPLGMLASLGRRSAVAEIVGLRFSGFAAWWLEGAGPHRLDAGPLLPPRHRLPARDAIAHRGRETPCLKGERWHPRPRATVRRRE